MPSSVATPMAGAESLKLKLMIPSMSSSARPASAIALLQASDARLRTVRPDSRVKSVLPMPAMAYLSLRAHMAATP